VNNTAGARGATSEYSKCSCWLETCGDELAPRTGVDGSIDVDIAILGAGYTGLWTAYYLLKREPSLRVAILERRIAGFGASGRNGGWVSSKLNIGLDAVARMYGRGPAPAPARALYGTLDECARV